MVESELTAQYTNSHALVIGIDEYPFGQPLSYATSDAKAIAEILIDRFEFPKENVTVLLDSKATRDSIRKAFFDLVGERVKPNDRVIIFFAGHGKTLSGESGEIGFLIPNDGDPKDVSSWIPWSDLTGNAGLIRAKHIFFIMDACYGGIVLQRTGRGPGSMRFVKDMLRRTARQVLTAGKADETVSDSGGPLAGHSVFTGHLIEGLKGNAISNDGVLSACGIMSYVYERVSRDVDSHQTPAFGSLRGDGDFILSNPRIESQTNEECVEKDLLFAISATVAPGTMENKKSVIERAKEYLSDPKCDIQLHDLVTEQLREFLAFTSSDNFKVQGIGWSKEEFFSRLDGYEKASENLRGVGGCLGHWGNRDRHFITLRKLVARPTDRLEIESGNVAWLRLRWYPLILLAYSTGIGAIAGNNFRALCELFQASVRSQESSHGNETLILSVGESLLELVRTNMFKQIPDFERRHTPISDYLFNLLQPEIDNLLFLGSDYEKCFDRFEVFLALAHADARVQTGSGVWGPFGRFGWKWSGGRWNPLGEIIKEAEVCGIKWRPYEAGLFGGDPERFQRIAAEFATRVAKLGWY